MSVERNFSIFNLADVLLGKRVTEKHVQKVFAGINYLFEAIGDEAPPNSGSQVVQGHDHADQGGLPIMRGGVLQLNGGRNPLWSNDPTASLDRIDLGLDANRIRGTAPAGSLPSKVLRSTLAAYASPGIDTVLNGVHWDMRLRVYWPSDAGYDCFFKVENMDIVTPFPWVKAETSTEVYIKPMATLQEIHLKVPVRGDYYNRLMLRFRAETGAPDSNNTLDIYNLNIAESWDISQPKGSGKLRYK